MFLTNNDASEFVVPRLDDVPRLVLEFGEVDLAGGGLRRTTSERLPVRATVGDGSPVSGELVIDPGWTQPVDAPLRVPSKYQSSETPRTSVGKELFLRLFSAELSRSWAEAADLARARNGLHVVIRSAEAAVQALPWELLEEPVGSAGPLIRQAGWSVIRQYPRDPATLPSPATPRPSTALRVLVMTADMVGISQDGDREIVSAALQDAQVDVVPSVDRISLLDHLAAGPHDLVHVLGNGAVGRKGDQLLVVGTPKDHQTVTAGAIFDALGDRAADLRLLVLAACETDLLAAELAERVPNVIGIRSAISDEGCLAFLRFLYGALGLGATIDQAVTAGRAQQVAYSRSFGEEWSLPVLYQSDGTPLVATTVTGPAPGAAAPAVEDDPALVPEDPASDPGDRLVREMKRVNLLSLRKQWSGTDADSLPSFVRRQLDSLESEVGRQDVR